VKPYGPSLLKLPVVNRKDIKDCILTKFHNGYVQATQFSPPLNRLFIVPRNDTIATIAKKYPKETKKEYQEKKENRT